MFQHRRKANIPLSLSCVCYENRHHSKIKHTHKGEKREFLENDSKQSVKQLGVIRTTKTTIKIQFPQVRFQAVKVTIC